ncbi:MAG: tetratricopeptide repeat protein [Acidobacteria bacterium]|nr:tetratricopeptide repeat protein [Acidobacteriota bacterium]
MKESDELLQKGKYLLERNNLEQAAVLFESALTLEQREGEDPSARLLSYCGYTLAFARKKYLDGLKLCKRAVEIEFFNPDLFCNLGDIYLARGDKKSAHKAFLRGLAISPEHSRLRSRMKEMGIRKRNIFSFLSRQHRLNSWIGQFFRAND